MAPSEEERNVGECLDPAERERRILEAVEEDDVVSLKTLLNSPEWYRVKGLHRLSEHSLLGRRRPSCQRTLSLPTIAALKNCKEVFDYLLSLPNYPQEALGEALMYSVAEDFCDDEGDRRKYYACQLIERGADVHQRNLLHYAVQRNLLEVAERLIKKGADVNQAGRYGNTPLDACSSLNIEEAVAMLLFYGADPVSRHYRYGIELSSLDTFLRKTGESIMSSRIEEVFLNNISGVYTDYDIDVESVLRATELNSKIFYEIIKNTREVRFNPQFKRFFIGKDTPILFTMRTDFLKIIIKQFDYVIKTILSTNVKFSGRYRGKPLLIENLEVLLKSHLKMDFSDWLHDFNDGFIDYFADLAPNAAKLLQVTCFLLSHGMTVLDTDLEAVYRRFGHCELFKMLLHMDLENNSTKPVTCIIPYILYNVTLDIPKMIQDRQISFPTQFSAEELKKLLLYYTIPLDLLPDGNSENVQNQRRVPLLLELARNAFRRYLIETLNITNANQFYTVVKKLPISNYHKQIITLEAKLY